MRHKDVPPKLMAQVIDFEARAFGELSGSAEFAEDRAGGFNQSLQRDSQPQ